MGDEKDFGSGVKDVFDMLSSGEPAANEGEATGQEKNGKPKAPNSKQQKSAPSDIEKSQPKEIERPKARVGRLPGSKNSGLPPKEKITGRVDAALRDAYVEWSFAERCTMGELIERALVEFRQRHWKPTTSED